MKSFPRFNLQTYEATQRHNIDGNIRLSAKQRNVAILNFKYKRFWYYRYERKELMIYNSLSNEVQLTT